AAWLVVAAAPPIRGAPGRDGEVKAVSVLPAPGRVEVVIDLRGAVEVQDFTLASPARLVLDLQGARLVAPAALYDGQNRGGIKNVRYAQFRPGVVRVVIDLDVLKDYQIERRDGQVRVKIGTDRTAFGAWSSLMVATLPPPPPPGLAVNTLEGGIFQVIDKKDLARADSTVPVETRLVRVNYARASSLVPAIQSIVSKRGAVVADSSTNGLVITEIQSRIRLVEDFVKGLDIRTPQVSIQAKIIFIDRTDVEELGEKYDLGSTTQFFNRLIQRPDPRTA